MSQLVGRLAWTVALATLSFGVGFATIDFGARIAVAKFHERDIVGNEADPLGGVVNRVAASIERKLSTAGTYRGMLFGGALAAAMFAFAYKRKGLKLVKWICGCVLGTAAVWLSFHGDEMGGYVVGGIREPFNFWLEWLACGLGVGLVAVMMHLFWFREEGRIAT